MSFPAATTKLLYSDFASDPDLAELVEAFVAEMPLRCDLLRGHFAAQRWSELKRTAHQLKGAAGGYGFDQLTPFAASLERAVSRGADSATIESALDTLVEQCGRARSGTKTSRTPR